MYLKQNCFVVHLVAQNVLSNLFILLHPCRSPSLFIQRLVGVELAWLLPASQSPQVVAVHLCAAFYHDDIQCYRLFLQCQTQSELAAVAKTAACITLSGYI